MQKRLSPRKELILRSLVEEYIRTAEPVPSQMLATKFPVGISPATVRNELKAMEEDGLVFQRHTSAGRIPTDLGYRYFVERLMHESALSLDEQRQIRHQFYQVQYQLDQWVRLTASILSQALASAAVVTLPRASSGRLRHFELLALHETVALLVVVLHDSSVEQTRIFLDDAASQDELSRMALALNARFRGCDAHAVAAAVDDPSGVRFTPNERTVILALAQTLEQHNHWNPEDVYQDGLTRMLNQPEFTRMGEEHERGERIRTLVASLEQHRLLPLIDERIPIESGVQVVIGGETGNLDLKDVSLVISRYGLPGQISGWLGVVGPTRMQYGRAVAIVRYMTELMNELLADLYGSGQPYERDSTRNS